jgi:hypothetical protein
MARLYKDYGQAKLSYPSSIGSGVRKVFCFRELSLDISKNE